MVELAIFGSFLLFGLALIVRTAVSSYYAQQVSQEAFRLALKKAYETRAYDGEPGNPPAAPRPEMVPSNQASVTLVRDLFLPDPTEPFTSGVPNPVIGNASVTWGTDGAEFSAHDLAGNSDLPKQTIQLNDKTFHLLTARFTAVPFTPYSAFRAQFPQLLCKYSDAYGAITAEFFDAGGGKIQKVKADTGKCITATSSATISYDGASPVSARILISDVCRADAIDPSECAKQCRRIQDNGLPVPAYCNQAPINPLRKHPGQGLDVFNFVRDYQVNNSLRRDEDQSATTTNAIINEVITVHRKIRTNPLEASGYATKNDTFGPYIDAKSSNARSKTNTWRTQW